MCVEWYNVAVMSDVEKGRKYLNEIYYILVVHGRFWTQVASTFMLRFSPISFLSRISLHSQPLLGPRYRQLTFHHIFHLVICSTFVLLNPKFRCFCFPPLIEWLCNAYP